MREGYLTRTWQFELLFVVVVLALVALLSGKGPIEWIGSLAVVMTFAHIQVADRLAEQASLEESSRGQTTVECHWKLKWYLISKESLWLIYFVLLDAWSALAGVALFLLYPVWRHWYRRLKPLARVEEQHARREQTPGPG